MDWKCLLFASAIVASHALVKEIPQLRDLFADTWTATDGLGRIVATDTFAGKAVKHRAVAMFYFLSNHCPGAPVYDNTKLIATNPANPQFGPYGSAHWWGEPWFGYYQSDDRQVIRKHMQMLADAGVDVIVFDNTNGPTYPDVYIPLLEVIKEIRAAGNPCPQVAFFTGHGAWSTIYRDLYAKNLYSDLWYRWKGKPLMMAHLETNDHIPADVGSFFTIRESWAWTPSEWFGNGHDKWPWLDNFPQNFGWHEAQNQPEEVSVCVGQHATSSIGRSSTGQHEPPVDEFSLTPDTPKGNCFAEQFERAIHIDPELIFVTGWNEWTATRFPQEQAGAMAGRPMPKGGSFFVDEYNAEFSRDIEPANGITSDNYYYQLASFVRRYKGARPTLPVSRLTIRPNVNFDAWKLIAPEFRDEIGDPVRRDNPGWGTLRYTNMTGRNDIESAKVAYDAENVYFYVHVHGRFSPSTDPNWMMLFLDVDHDAKTGWLGYDFVINRDVRGRTTSLERNIAGKYRWSPAARLAFATGDHDLVITIPRAKLGIRGRAATIDFKWADNIQQTGDASDFTLNGDAAPNDRFNYRAILGL